LEQRGRTRDGQEQGPELGELETPDPLAAVADRAGEADDRPGRRLLGKGSIYTLGTALQLSAAALAIPVITRLLGSGEFGVVALAMALQLMLTALATLGLPTAILRFFFDHERKADAARAARSLIISAAVIAAAVVCPILLTGLIWAPALSPNDPGPVLLGAFLALPAGVIGACLALLRAQERPLPFIVITLLASTGAQLLGIAALLIDRQPLAYVAGVAIAFLIAAIASLRLTGTLGTPPATRSLLGSALRYSIPTIPNTISVSVLAVGDRIVIQAISGSSAVGKYQIANAFGTLVVGLLVALQNAWLPITFGASEERRWDTLAEIAALVTRLAALGAGVLALVALPILQIVVPRGYDPEHLADVASVAVLTSLPEVAFLAQGQVLLWMKQTKPLLWISPTAAALNLILVVILVPPFGLIGAAAATVLAVFAQAAITRGVAARMAHVSWQWTSEATSYLIAATLVALALLLPATAWAIGARAAVSALAAGTLLIVVRREFRPGWFRLG
jgi:O-antigen/teichoic acid export membrane protein